MQCSSKSTVPSSPQPQTPVLLKAKREKRKAITFPCGCTLYHANGCIREHSIPLNLVRRGLFGRTEESTPCCSEKLDLLKLHKSSVPRELQPEEDAPIESVLLRSEGLNHISPSLFTQRPEGNIHTAYLETYELSCNKSRRN